ncbi:hypothetical protein YWS52_10370 [Chitiniphilus shinanonensis]
MRAAGAWQDRQARLAASLAGSTGSAASAQPPAKLSITATVPYQGENRGIAILHAIEEHPASTAAPMAQQRCLKPEESGGYNRAHRRAAVVHLVAH